MTNKDKARFIENGLDLLETLRSGDGEMTPEQCVNLMDWLVTRVEALEAENTHITKFVEASINAIFAQSKRNEIQRKWARRWKKAARREREDAYDSITTARTLFRCEKEIYMTEVNHLIVALENAAKRCGTCLYLPKTLDYDTPERCLECTESKRKFELWAFDEERFAKKGNGEVDVLL